MRILAINGSARKGGNTEILIKEALRGAGAEGTKIVSLAKVDFGGCIGCRACRKDGAKGCVVDDGMQKLYREIKKADALILGSPIYYGEVTGQMKCFMDRWYALRDKDRALRIPSGKKAVFIITQGADGEDRYKGAATRIEKILTSYEMSPQVVIAPGVEGRGDVKNRPALLAGARQAGSNLT